MADEKDNQSKDHVDSNPHFDIDTGVRPDTDPAIFPPSGMTYIHTEHGTYTYGQDEYGEYGSVFNDEDEYEKPDPDWYRGDEDEMRAKSTPEEFERWLKMRDELGVSAEEYNFISEDEMREMLKPEAFEKWKWNRDAWLKRTSSNKESR